MDKFYIVKHPKKKRFWSGLDWTGEKVEARVFTKEGAQILVNKRWPNGVRKLKKMGRGVNAPFRYTYQPQPKIKELKNTKRMAG